MAIKVLVFESDAAFAGELRTELGKLGCTTQIVDDGNVGLQQAVSDRPDLILLSIELPRMNGFSVCNKLKKDASLKDVPLIIMSSESSDETFEQHRKLRTRAEDYVHKPIAFGELLQHIQPFVALGTSDGSGGGDDQIYIDDDVVVDDSYGDDDSHTQVGRMPDFAMEAAPPPAAMPATAPKSYAPKKPVDADIDAFADAAFGRITQSNKPPPPAAGTNGSQLMDVTVATRVSDMPSMPVVLQHPPQPPHQDDSAEQVRELERQLLAVKSENARLQDGLEKAVQPEDMERLQREVEDLRTRLASSGKGGAVSSREFLDLRENLNKKDKEILSLRETLAKKDKEVVESRERSLEFARAKGDADDRILAVEREIADGRDKIEALTGDKDQAKKASEDFRSRMTRAQADLEVRVKEVDELRAKYAEEISANEAGITALHAEHAAELAETIERAANEKDSALGSAKFIHAEELEKLRSGQQRLLDETNTGHATELEQVRASLNGQLEQVRSSLNGQLEQARTAHAQEIEGARASHASQLEQAQSSYASELANALTSHAGELANAQSSHASELANVQSSHANELEALVASHADALAQAQSSHANELAELDARRRSELAKATEEGDNALSEALERAAREKAQAVGKREEEMREQYASDLSVLKAEHHDELNRARSDFSRELEAAKNTHAQELGDGEERRLEEVETAKQQGRDRLAARERELTSAQADTVGEIERARDQQIAAIELARDEQIAIIERDRDDLVQALERDRAEKIENLERDRDLRIGDMRAEHETTLSSMTREHSEKVATLENDRDARLAALEARLAREVGEALTSAAEAKSAAESLISSLTRDLDDAREQLSAITQTKRENDSNNAAKIAELEDQLANAVVARDSASRDLNGLRDRLAVAEAESINLRSDLGRTREQLATESARADKALTKWESDRGSLERAKDALAVALSQIEEAEARP